MVCGAWGSSNCVVTNFLEIIYDHGYISADIHLSHDYRAFIEWFDFLVFISNCTFGIALLSKCLLHIYTLLTKWGSFSHLVFPDSDLRCLPSCPFLNLFFPILFYFQGLHWCNFPRTCYRFSSFSFSSLSLHHRDVEMNLSLSASQDQAVMLALK